MRKWFSIASIVLHMLKFLCWVVFFFLSSNEVFTIREHYTISHEERERKARDKNQQNYMKP